MDRAEEIAALEAKLAASKLQGGGYGERVKAIERRLKELRDAG
ncbi:hypothetical protein ACFSTI_29330 [Rhizorhabdus histidinilytica]|nr:hypothetical protein [Rhizorhabdus histidinilytica]